MLCSGVALEDAYGWVAMEEHCLWKYEQTHKSRVSCAWLSSCDLGNLYDAIYG
jgi:hypothetical protein